MRDTDTSLYTKGYDSKQQNRREETGTHLGSTVLPPVNASCCLLFFAVKILFLVGRVFVFLKVASPSPHFEISPSWGWPKRKQVFIVS